MKLLSVRKSDQSEMFVKNLEPGEEYLLGIFIIDEDGSGEKIEIQARTLQEKKSKEDRTDSVEDETSEIALIVWGIIGALFVLVIVFSIITFLGLVRCVARLEQKREFIKHNTMISMQFNIHLFLLDLHNIISGDSDKRTNTFQSSKPKTLSYDFKTSKVILAVESNVEIKNHEKLNLLGTRYTNYCSL